MNMVLNQSHSQSQMAFTIIRETVRLAELRAREHSQLMRAAAYVKLNERSIWIPTEHSHRKEKKKMKQKI